MSDPTTRPGELSRLAGGDEYRLFMLEKVIAISEESSANSVWRKAHDEADDARFAEIHKELEAIKNNAGVVTSSVNGLRESKAQVMGIRDALWTTAKVIAATIAAAWAIFITFFHKP